MSPDSLAALNRAERLNFLLTNRIPRRWLTLLVGRLSRIRSPLFAKLTIGAWQLFVDDLRLHEAQDTRFDSLHACFTRRLKPGARPISDSADTLVSPCDGILGAHGSIDELRAIQAKGFPYSIADLVGDANWAARYRNGSFLTLRLKSSMYHRFHAPDAGTVDRLNYISGDTWNVNPVALRVIERLYCKNERVAMEMQLAGSSDRITLVAVAAVLVASVRIHGLPGALDLRYRGPNRIRLRRSVARGEELGYFEHGSTIVMLLPGNLRVASRYRIGDQVRMGQPITEMVPVKT